MTHMNLRPDDCSISLVDLGLDMQRTTSLDALIHGVIHDSQQVQPGDLFVAVPGLDVHGMAFIDQAILSGAVAVASDQAGVEFAQQRGVPTLLLEQPRSDMALAAATIYGHPQRKLTLIGVTGTNGKTTVTHIMKSLLQDSGRSVGMIGTLGSFANDESLPSKRTTPESPDLFALFAMMVQRNVDTVVMEVSSHALELGRVDHVMFDVAVFTNLTQDHLDFHSDMQSYFAAKSKLFTPERCRTAVVCVDDAWGRTLAEHASVPMQTVSIAGNSADWSVENISSEVGKSSFTLTPAQGAAMNCEINLLGDFNVCNSVEAVIACSEIGLSFESLWQDARHIRPVPGRLERVAIDTPYLALVDYAHTPDAVEKVLTELRKQSPRRIITVLGCGGDRDSAKRPHMGRIASELSDLVVVTDDNPRSEVAADIRTAVLAEITLGNAVEIGDRRKAIRHALSLAGPNDIVAVLGKGHELGQEIDGVVYPFSDALVIREEASRA